MVCMSAKRSQKSRYSVVNASGRVVDFVHAFDVVGLRSFLRRHKDLGDDWLSAQDSLGYTPLHHAIINGDTLSLAVLLSAGANPFRGRNLCVLQFGHTMSACRQSCDSQDFGCFVATHVRFNETPAKMLRRSLCLKDAWSTQAAPMFDIIFANSSQQLGTAEFDQVAIGDYGTIRAHIGRENDGWEHFDDGHGFSWEALRHIPASGAQGVFRIDAKAGQSVVLPFHWPKFT